MFSKAAVQSVLKSTSVKLSPFSSFAESAAAKSVKEEIPKSASSFVPSAKIVMFSLRAVKVICREYGS